MRPFVMAEAQGMATLSKDFEKRVSVFCDDRCQE